MLGAFLYVDAGKGHYVPALALADKLEQQGHQALVEDMFLVCNSPFWSSFCKKEWRFMLRHPRIEGAFHRLHDTKFMGAVFRFIVVRIHLKRGFLAWYTKTKPDFIVCTNFLGANVITPIVQKLELPIPVFGYAADVFNNPTAGFNKKLDLLYIATFVGRDLLLAKGHPPERVKVCPFPLKSSIEDLPKLTKKKARELLGIKDTFTVLQNFGGEGIGNTEFVYEAARRGLPWQVVVVGKLTNHTKKRFAAFQRQYPNFTLYTPGFIDNIGEYIYACDVQVGKAGANALMESMALSRPFLVSDLLFAARDTTTFLNKYKVGWSGNKTKRQIDILQTYYQDKEEQIAMEKRFSSLPLSFSSKEFILDILEEVARWKPGYATRGE
ncbi:MAG TPA: UDP-N-acetylglucosamine--LPS N-acetylglucosamine transferase [Spirochaetales bacterium]|jgi:processive 1,2-diacylglycerol beta-glucosyltransferase|nr:UDP-N-acetylglucosamine--LPS N-acetylglucosamine transferase [Spirochaetales bacterium]